VYLRGTIQIVSVPPLPHIKEDVKNEERTSLTSERGMMKTTSRLTSI